MTYLITTDKAVQDIADSGHEVLEAASELKAMYPDTVIQIWAFVGEF